jgi:hypothetical protein
MFRLTLVIVRLRSEPFDFSSIITYRFLFWSLLTGVKWWLAFTDMNENLKTYTKKCYQESRLIFQYHVSSTYDTHLGSLVSAADHLRTARHGTARHGTARHGTARHGTARHGTA